MSDVVTAVPLKRTPLYRLHLDLGGRMVPFAGYEMPVQYPSGILKEHLHVRAAAGLFDVSHMGQFEIRSRTGGARTPRVRWSRSCPWTSWAWLLVGSDTPCSPMRTGECATI